LIVKLLNLKLPTLNRKTRFRNTSLAEMKARPRKLVLSPTSSYTLLDLASGFRVTGYGLRVTGVGCRV